MKIFQDEKQKQTNANKIQSCFTLKFDLQRLLTVPLYMAKWVKYNMMINNTAQISLDLTFVVTVITAVQSSCPLRTVTLCSAAKCEPKNPEYSEILMTQKASKSRKCTFV